MEFFQCKFWEVAVLGYITEWINQGKYLLSMVGKKIIFISQASNPTQRPLGIPFFRMKYFTVINVQNPFFVFKQITWDDELLL